MNIRNLYDNYNSYFNADLKKVFQILSSTAKDNFFIYLIGGIVRDMLLNRNCNDIDVIVEDNAIEFAKCLEEQNLAQIKSIHKDFGTAKVLINGIDIDLASTRSETYPNAGQLPIVEQIGCELKEDIKRRDFTINSLAMSLNQDDFGELIDYTNGIEDLKNKKIKILHEKSFIDDPTRIIRGLKYASRLNFELDENTQKLQEKYLNNINYDMCYKRVLQEFEKTFSVQNPPFKEFVEQKIYKLINPDNVKPITISGDYPWIVYFGLVAPCDIEKFSLTKVNQNIIENAKSLISQNFETDFEIYKAYCNQKQETIDILCLQNKKEAIRYKEHLSKIKILTSGDDLIKLGIKPSAKFGEYFDYILSEKLKAPDLDKSGELELFKKNFLFS